MSFIVPLDVLLEIVQSHRRCIKNASERRCRKRNVEKTQRRQAQVREARRRWRQANPGASYQSRRRWRAANVVKALLSGARASAKSRGMRFSITERDIPPLGSMCPVFGLKFAPLGKYDDLTPSIDRIDSSKGYVPGNVWIIGRRANRIKNDGTAAEHEAIAAAMRRAGVR